MAYYNETSQVTIFKIKKIFALKIIITYRKIRSVKQKKEYNVLRKVISLH